MGQVVVSNKSSLGVADGSIELDKLENVTDGQMIVGSATNVPTAVAMSGDVAIINDGTSTIQEGAVEDSMIEGLAAGQIILGVDGTAANNLKAVLSGDVTMDAAGAVTIGAGAVEESMIAVPNVDALNVKRIARATYDYTEHGGAVSTIGLGVTVPDDAIVTRTYYEVITTLTSNAANDAATISFDIPVDDVAGLVAATAISAGGNIWDAGYHDGIQDGTAAAFAVKTTAARELSITIGVEAIDAPGIVVFICEYVVTQ